MTVQHKITTRAKRLTGPTPVQDEQPPPPAGLSERAERVWEAANEEFVFNEAELALLSDALRHLDISAAALSEVQADGPVVKPETGIPRRHPGYSVAHDALRTYRAALKDLGLRDVEAM